jgi:hypothetical protein
LPTSVGARSKARRTAFTRSSTGVVGSNPTRSVEVCGCLFYVCVILRRADLQSKKSYRLRVGLRNRKSGKCST